MRTPGDCGRTLAYQTDNRFHSRDQAGSRGPNNSPRAPKAGNKGEKLSLNFQNVEGACGAAGHRRLHGPQHHHQRHGLRQPDAAPEGHPWDQALDIILQTKGLDMRKNGNVVLIAPREELALKEKQQLENALQIAQLEPLISESFQLNYIKASDLQN
jgi:type IV pilus assembly protein PilQ